LLGALYTAGKGGYVCADWPAGGLRRAHDRLGAQRGIRWRWGSLAAGIEFEGDD